MPVRRPGKAVATVQSADRPYGCQGTVQGVCRTPDAPGEEGGHPPASNVLHRSLAGRARSGA